MQGILLAALAAAASPADTLESCWKALLKNPAVLADLPGDAGKIKPGHPQIVKVSDMEHGTSFQDYTVYAAGVEDWLIVGLFDAKGTLLDYFLRRPPKGAKATLVADDKKNNEAAVVFSSEKEDKELGRWRIAFSWPAFK